MSNKSNGIIYLVQPAELVGTNRYKVGCSSNKTLDRVKKGYKKGTRYLHISECENPFEIESEIKKIFNEKYNLIAGKEYFEVDNESNMIEIFTNIIINWNKNIEDDVNDDDINDDDVNDDVNDNVKKHFPNHIEDVAFGGNKKLIKINIDMKRISNLDFSYIITIIDIYDEKNVNDDFVIDVKRDFNLTGQYYFNKLIKNNVIQNNEIYDLNSKQFINKLNKYKLKLNVEFDKSNIEILNSQNNIRCLIDKYLNSDTVVNDKYYVDTHHYEENKKSFSLYIHNYSDCFHNNSKYIYITNIHNSLIDEDYMRKYLPYCIDFYKKNNKSFIINRHYEYISFNSKSPSAIEAYLESDESHDHCERIYIKEKCPWTDEKTYDSYLLELNNIISKYNCKIENMCCDTLKLMNLFIK